MSNACNQLTFPLLTSSAFLGFSLLAVHALGVTPSLPAVLVLFASAALIYTLDRASDLRDRPLRQRWLGLLGAIVSAAVIAASLPWLRLRTCLALAAYLPLGVLWTAPILPFRKSSSRALAWKRPRELALKPYLVGLAGAAGTIGVPLAQASLPPMLPLGLHAWLAPQAYVALFVAFVAVACTTNALTMDLADLYGVRSAAAAPFVCKLGQTRGLDLQRTCALLQLVLATLLATGIDNPAVGAPIMFVAAYTALASHAVRRCRHKWIRALACDLQGLAILVGFALVELSRRVRPLATPLVDTALRSPESWPAWIHLSVLTGAGCWLVAYMLMLRAGLEDRTWCMPAGALFLNISWEFQHAFVTPEPFPASLVNMLWFVLDLEILAQLLQHAPARFVSFRLPRAWVGPSTAAAALMAYVGQLGFDLEFANNTGEYAAFTISAVMSLLFVRWAITSSSLRGQRPAIALAKGIGNVLYVAPVYVLTGSALLLIQGVIIAVLDLAYYLILLQRRGLSRQRESPLGLTLDHGRAGLSMGRSGAAPGPHRPEAVPSFVQAIRQRSRT